MLLRGIAFSEARRSVTRRILKPQNSSCEKDNTELTYDEVFQSNLGSKENTYSQSINEHSSTNFLPPEGEAKSFVATASKLAAVEDAAPKGPEASIRSKATALKVSPTARATLQALRSPRNRVSSPLTPSPTTTKDAETITGDGESSRPSGTVRLKKLLERKESILRKWRDEKICFDDNNKYEESNVGTNYEKLN
ncbi:PREDICTED: uncharacterized protein LOC108574545 [Habropoda laboriosa]|uniref:uncharacterized protein LOC108574545 n=1 Tax=Habropoda laboriosa TaxID=597456 RepID=UPI00083D5794|nr:PREDICTED: uncharacterized protein LOC108574545 [Habropoda laboriosa]